jgi:oligopeptide transport system ATP-binding protein
MTLEVRNLKKHFEMRQGFFGGRARWLKAVDGISFSIERGETFSLVGESGCGKTTAARTIARIYEPTEGSIVLDGDDISRLGRKEMLPYRKRMQMIFQDPYASLDPRMTVGEIIGEALGLHGMRRGKERDERIAELIGLVGLKGDHAGRYPHEFSGGQRQRIGIARALAVEPEFVICDEPISALDVSIQAQVINMLEELQERLGLTYLFVSHDLSMVRHISHRVGVMYLGNLVETADVDELFSDMRHPYTKALLSAAPVADPRRARTSRRILLTGDVPSPLDPPSGCPFRTRCAIAKPLCAESKPALEGIAGASAAGGAAHAVAGHAVACHFAR